MNEKASRAKQFLPFAALKGYYDQIRERERILDVRRELSEEEIAQLSRKLELLKKGMMAKVKFYNIDAYETIEGMVAQIDIVFRTLTIVKTKIPLDDIIQLNSEEIIQPISGISE